MGCYKKSEVNNDCCKTLYNGMDTRLPDLWKWDGRPDGTHYTWDQNLQGRPWVHFLIHGPDLLSGGPGGPTKPVDQDCLITDKKLEKWGLVLVEWSATACSGGESGGAEMEWSSKDGGEM